MAVELVDLVILIIANGIVDTLFVAYVAGIRSKAALVSWLKDEKQAGPYYDQIARRAASRATEQLTPMINTKLEDLHKTVAHLEARVSAEMPHPDAAIADMKAELESRIDELVTHVDGELAGAKGEIQGVDRGIQAAMAQLDGLLEELPERIKMTVLSQKGVFARNMNAALREGAEIVADETGLTEQLDNPIVSWLQKPIEEDPEKPWLAPITAMIKSRMAQELGVGRAGAPPGNGSSRGSYEPVR